MNSEELERSLRTEFESYLKGFLAELRQEVSEFQKSFETEFEKHKAQTDEAVRRLVGRFDKDFQFDQSFSESVLEHLRLARDEGATITAVAIGEAEKLKEESEAAAAAPPEYDKLRDAINEITSKTSQSEILRSLVENASQFAPRGAFFIVKNEQFVGWRAFGDEASVDEATVRAMQFPITNDTVLAEAVNALATASSTSGSHSDDRQFLDGLEFGKPDRMYAIPLVARGRGVAVLYADYGTEGVALNPEALETLVRVAGLTVELAAAGVQPAPVPQYAAAAPAAEKAAEPVQEKAAPVETAAVPVEEPTVEEAPAEVSAEFESQAETEFTEAEPADSYGDRSFDAAEAETTSYEPAVEEPAVVEEYQQPVEFKPEPSVFEPKVSAAEPVEEYTFEPVEETAAFEEKAEETVETTETAEAVEKQIPVDRFGEFVSQPAEEVTYFEPVEEAAAEPEYVQPEIVQEYTPQAEAAEEFPDVIEEKPEPVMDYVPVPEYQVEANNVAPAATVSEPVAEVATAQAARTRYRDRNVDLPIEVPEDERRLHNDARRFARLLVSEIKLYNEQKVTEGRQSGDLYDRLREAIDRSRDMYDKRVQQPVAEKFDYFHYELVNSLAEGEDVKLGAAYPGSKVPA